MRDDWITSARVLGITLFALAALMLVGRCASAQEASPRPGDMVPVTFMCRSADDFRYIFAAADVLELATRVDERLRGGDCIDMPAPLPGLLHEIVFSTEFQGSGIDVWELTIVLDRQVLGPYYSWSRSRNV